MELPPDSLSRQNLQLKPAILDIIDKLISASQFIGGEHVRQFEQSFASLVQANHCISCGNGTDALYIALKCLDLPFGSEVIVPAHTWISTAEIISQCGHKPIFADTDPHTFTISPDSIRSRITKHTQAIIVVHLYGHPAPMDDILSISRQFGLYVIEDCAQAHLATYNNRPVGSFGDIACYSFYPSKNLGALGDAGAITVNDSSKADWMRLYSTHGGKGKHTIEGINSRMDSIQAAILNYKLQFLPAWTSQRRANANIYNQLFANSKCVVTPYVKENCTHVYHQYTIKCNERDQLLNHLLSNGIRATIQYQHPLPQLPAYRRYDYPETLYPVTLENHTSILSLPVFPELSFDEIAYIAQTINSFYE